MANMELSKYIKSESVELAKKYAGPEDASYINGVLGGYVRGTMGEAALPKEAEE